MNYKNNLFLTLLAIFISLSSIACTIVPETFCSSIQLQPDYNIISGKIVGVDQDGITVEVFNVIRGEELRDTIRVWDGTDFDCNGIWSMAASDIGSVSDTIIISLPKIFEKENEWDVIDDYRRPDPYSYTSELRVKDGLANGFLSGLAGAPASYNVYSFDYNLLVESLSAGLMCSDFISAIELAILQKAISYSNPVSTDLILNVTEPYNDLSLSIYALNGKIVKQVAFDSNTQLNVSLELLSSSVYILEFKVGDRIVMLDKLIKI